MHDGNPVALATVMLDIGRSVSLSMDYSYIP